MSFSITVSVMLVVLCDFDRYGHDRSAALQPRAKSAPQRMMRGLSQLDGIPRETGRQEAKRKFFFMQRVEGSAQPMKVEPMRHSSNLSPGGVVEAQLMRATSTSRPAHTCSFERFERVLVVLLPEVRRAGEDAQVVNTASRVYYSGAAA